MQRVTRWFGILFGVLLVQSCAVAPAPDPKLPDGETRKIVARRVSAVVVTNEASLKTWVNGRFAVSESPGDADGGSATPVSHDGYFLTADHVLARMDGRNVFILFGRNGRLSPLSARVVWRDARSDLALLSVEAETPNYYRWSDPAGWVPAGSGVMHGGIATGFKSPPGRMATSLAPEGMFTGTRSFKIDIPLQPGDSGGPVVDAYGKLVGINSAVEFLVPMETAFFVDSEAKRPNTRLIEKLIMDDRAQKVRAGASGD